MLVQSYGKKAIDTDEEVAKMLKNAAAKHLSEKDAEMIARSIDGVLYEKEQR